MTQTIQQIPGTFADAVNQLKLYKNIFSIIPMEKFERRVMEKYPNGPELAYGDVYDFYTALFHAKYLPHEGNAASPESMFITMDHCLPLLNLSDTENRILADKLLQLRSTAFWDTFSEIGVSTVLRQNMKDSKVELEYKFDKSKGNQSKDADIALLSITGESLLLLDVYTPKRNDDFVPSIESTSNYVSRKYKSKFEKHCLSNPKEKVSVVVSILENEMGILPYLLHVMNGKIGSLSPDLSNCPNLSYAQLCTFRCRNPSTKILEMIPLAKYTQS